MVIGKEPSQVPPRWTVDPMESRWDSALPLVPSATTNSVQGRPSTSSPYQPNSSSAAGFQPVIRPRWFSTTTGSGSASRTAIAAVWVLFAGTSSADGCGRACGSCSPVPG